MLQRKDTSIDKTQTQGGRGGLGWGWAWGGTGGGGWGGGGGGGGIVTIPQTKTSLLRRKNFPVAYAQKISIIWTLPNSKIKRFENVCVERLIWF